MTDVQEDSCAGSDQDVIKLDTKTPRARFGIKALKSQHEMAEDFYQMLM